MRPMRAVAFNWLVKPWGLGISDLSGTAAQWWLREFLALFPEPVAEWLMGHTRKALVLEVRPDVIGLHLLSNARRCLATANVRRANFGPDSIDAFLRAHGLERSKVALGIRLPATSIFGRRLLLPIEAARSVDRIVVEDMIRKTPFRLDDVFHGHVTTRPAVERKLAVHQWVTRREFVYDAAAALGLDTDDLAFIDAQGDVKHEEPSPLITLLSDRVAHRSRAKKAAMILTLSALVLGTATGTLKYRRQQTLLDDLYGQVAAANVKARQVRAAIDKLEGKHKILSQIHSQKLEDPGLLDLWEEVTRVLPAHSWLTELRLSEIADGKKRQITLTGFSTAAASLVGLLDGSSLFTDASLTAPVALDHVEERERFVIQADLRKQEPIRRASR